jgi:hypothetical protein
MATKTKDHEVLRLSLEAALDAMGKYLATLERYNTPVKEQKVAGWVETFDEDYVKDRVEGLFLDEALAILVAMRKELNK